MRVSRLIIAAVTTALVSNAGLARVIYVNQYASGANTGANWASAYNELYDALAAAAPGDDIWVARGRYTPPYIPAAGGGRGVSFSLKDGVDLYGGFLPGATSVNDRDPSRWPTVLSALISTGSGTVNAYKVLSANNVGNARVDGFTISDGLSDGAAGSATLGGGLYLSNSTVWVWNCRFENNQAKSGGAIAVWNDSQLQVRDSVFVNNRASPGNGGAIDIDAFQTASLANVGRSRFHDNWAVGQGSAISSRGALYASNSVFDANTSQGIWGGAIYAEGDLSVLDLRNLTVVNNTSSGYTGGVVDQSPNRQIRNSILWDNDGTAGTWQSELFSLPDCDVTHNIIDEFDVLVGCPLFTNLDVDPMFLDPAGPDGIAGTEDDDYRIRGISPAVDSGDNAAYGAFMSTVDFRGADRFQAGPLGGAETIDRGAFEWQPTDILPDCPADVAEPFGLLDLADVSAFLAAFIANDPLADLNGDGLFDVADLVIFIESIVSGCL